MRESERELMFHLRFFNHFNFHSGPPSLSAPPKEGTFCHVRIGAPAKKIKEWKVTERVKEKRVSLGDDKR